MTESKLKYSGKTISFADVAHQMLNFNTEDEAARLVLELTDSSWVQRLRNIRQTGYTNFVYMFAEHSRFGHSLGVAYLSLMLMEHLGKFFPDKILPYKNAVAAAAILHDIGHVAPGSHLAERVWSLGAKGKHELVTIRAIQEDREIQTILGKYSPQLPEQVCNILSENPMAPAWAKSIISGGGWNADRGNWAIVDSAMCSVTYGRYNVQALVDAFLLSDSDELILQENRLDALTHFFLARDSMYRQIYQHRTLQATDRLAAFVAKRVRDIIPANSDAKKARQHLADWAVYCDETMAAVLISNDYTKELSLPQLFEMTESWWNYHLNKWCDAKDQILRDLASRLRDRRLFKTIRLQAGDYETNRNLQNKADEIAKSLGFDPDYYVAIIDDQDKHRGKNEEAPKVLLDNGSIVSSLQVEPLIRKLFEKSTNERVWLVVPKEVKEKLGRIR